MFYYTYVLKSLKDKKLYIGWTVDLKLRLQRHNDGKVIATRTRTPLKLIYYEACLNKSKAIKREKYFKMGFGRRFLKERT
jgi:putative endonuclease